MYKNQRIFYDLIFYGDEMQKKRAQNLKILSNFYWSFK